MKCLSFAALLSLVAIASAVTTRAQISWTAGQTDGAWSNPANWGGTVPGLADNVVIDVAQTHPWFLTVDGEFAMNSLNIADASWMIDDGAPTSRLTVAENFVWVDAWIRGPSIVNDGEMVIGNPNTARHHIIIDCSITRCGTFTNRGSVLLTPGIQSQFLLGDGVTLLNESGATFAVSYRSDAEPTSRGVAGHGLFENHGLLEFRNPTDLEWLPVIFNYGEVDLGGTELTFLGSFTEIAKFANFDSGVVRGSGSLDGTGTFDLQSFFLNEGTISPGYPVDPVGTIGLVADYNSTATAVYEVNISGAGNDRIEIVGEALLDGSLLVSTGAFAPVAGQEFEILTASDGVTGTFSSVSPDFDVRYEANRVVLISLAPPADCILFGTASSGGSYLNGVTVKLLDEFGIPVAAEPDVITSGNGEFQFGPIAAGTYQVLAVEPIGYRIADNPRLKVLECDDVLTSVDFVLEQFVLVNDARGRGYWKHQFDVFVSGRGSARESEASLVDYIQYVEDRYTTPYYPTLFANMSDGTSDLQEWQQVLTYGKKPSALKRATAELGALLLNITSSKLAQYEVVTDDGMSAADVLTLASEMVINGDPSDDALAKEIASQVNGQELVAAGLVPDGDRLYKTSSTEHPEQFSLDQNYPNPFNPVTTIIYQIDKSTSATLHLFDMLGREVRTLVLGNKEPGRYAVTLDLHDLPSGTYLYRLDAGGLSAIRRMVVFK